MKEKHEKQHNSELVKLETMTKLRLSTENKRIFQKV